jgi:UDP-N-acetylmuramate: L-alanyl-gamma-D-glutamyl-meso-diaminopimelate ligase
MTLAALRAQIGQHHRIVAVLEPRSNTMQMGVHKELLPSALADANYVVLYQPANLKWSLAEAVASLGEKVKILDSIEAIVNHIVAEVGPGDHVLVMSNGGFGGLHALLENELSL